MGRLIFGVLVLTVFASLLLANQDVFATDDISDKVKKQCEQKYESYKKFGTVNLQLNNPHLIYLKDCFKLYEDQNWSFIGKEKLDKYYEKKSQIPLNSAMIIKNYENQNLSITSMRTTLIGDGEYVLRVRLCVDDKTILEPKFFVVAEKEYFLAMGNMVLKADSCITAWTYVQSQDPEKITFIPFNGNYVPSNYMKIKSIY